MSSAWTIIYMAAVIIFIGWLLYRVRVLHKHHPGSHDPVVRHETPAGTAGSEFLDQGTTADTRDAGDRVAASPADTRVDDLTRIKGIGKVLAPKLQAMGIVSFEQVARLTHEDIERINAVLSFKGRIEREDWVGQAQRLVAAKAPKT